MKTLRNVLTAAAFVFAVGGAFASIAVQTTGFWDENGAAPLGGVSGTIDNSRNCAVQTGTICTIGGEPAFLTKADAESYGANHAYVTNLLKYQ